MRRLNEKAINFIKMHGIGNDFIVVDAITQRPLVKDFPSLARRINDRHFGVGGDGLIVITRGDQAPFRMRMLNPDGSEAEMCGNGIRCVAKYLREENITNDDLIRIETGAGVLELGIVQQNGKVSAVKVNMGKARFMRKDIPMIGPSNELAMGFDVQVGDKSMKATAVSMGNPHCVIFVESASDVPLEVWGPQVETNPMFPQRVNVHFVQVVSPQELVVRTWERGAGATLACGTGACASVVAAFLNNLAERRVTVRLPGGDLVVEYEPDGTVFMTGPAERVFEGTWISE